MLCNKPLLSSYNEYIKLALVKNKKKSVKCCHCLIMHLSNAFTKISESSISAQ